MVRTSYLWTASDPAYASVHGDDVLPDFAIGRLPAANVEKLRTMVEKIIVYETSGTLAGAAVLVADDPDGAGDFEKDLGEIASGVVASRRPRRIFLGELGAEAARGAIVDSFDEGVSLVSYAGHGGIDLWASEHILDGATVSAFAPQLQKPLVLTLNCLNGYFHFPYLDSLSEALVKADAKGAVAVISPSGLSLNGPAHLFHRLLLSELVSGRHERLGDVVFQALSHYAESGAFPELVRIYHLFGDPALTLR